MAARGDGDRCERGWHGEPADWVLEGLITRAGVIHVDGARANDEGLSLAIAVGPEVRVVGYSPNDLQRRRGREPWL